MAKGVTINFTIDSDHSQSNFPQYVYTGLTADNVTGTTICNGITASSCALTGLSDTLTQVYVKINCNGCDDQIFLVSLVDPTPTATPTPTLTATATNTPTSTPTQTPTNTTTEGATPTATPTLTLTATPTNTTSSVIAPTQTSTPTQTPTNTQTSTPSATYVYYKLRPCEYQGFTGYLDGDYDVWSYSLVSGTFSSGDRVEGSASYYYVVMGSQMATTDPTGGGTKYTVYAVEGETGCPAPPPSATLRTAYLTAAWAHDGSVGYIQQLADTCGLYPYQASSLGYTGLTQGGSTSFYVNEASIVPGTIYTLYDSNISGGGNVVNGGDKYYSILIYGSGSTFNYVVRISSSGELSEWNYCTTPTQTPTPTPTLTATPTLTPSAAGAPGSACIQITEYSSQGTTECLSNTVPYFYTVITALLTDGNGNAMNAVGDVYAYVNVTVDVLYQQENTYEYPIEISSGTSSGTLTIDTSVPVDNGQGNCENETRVINSYSAQVGYSICAP
jgi:hypothetical protein